MASHVAVVSCPLVPSYSIVDDDDERACYWKRLLGLWNLPARATRVPRDPIVE